MEGEGEGGRVCGFRLFLVSGEKAPEILNYHYADLVLTMLHWLHCHRLMLLSYYKHLLCVFVCVYVGQAGRQCHKQAVQGAPLPRSAPGRHGGRDCAAGTSLWPMTNLVFAKKNQVCMPTQT